MIKIGNNRQKLVLNRPTKPSVKASPQKPQLQIINFVKLSTLQPPLQQKDQNMIRISNSSISQKNNKDKEQIQRFSHNKQNKSPIIFKRKSLSIVQNNIDKKNTILPYIQRRASKTLGKILNKTFIYTPIIEEICKDKIAKLKQKGIFSFKNQQYSIKAQQLFQTIQEIVKKVTTQTNKINLKIQGSQPSIISQLQVKNKGYFNIHNQFNVHQTLNKARNLKLSPFIINFHAKYIQKSNERQVFWKMVQNFQLQKPTQQNFIFLINRYKYLKQQIRNKQIYLSQLNQNNDQLNQKIISQNKNIEVLQQKTNQHQFYLSSIQQKIRDIHQFVNNQPNKILRSQAQGYKQRQQQLFDQAFLLQQSTPLYLNSYVGDTIMVPNESFKLTLKSFPHQNADENNYYKITQKEMSAFKNSLYKAYESIIEKLSSLIQKKFQKIKKFVGIMRRLASYTIGKREYLTEINKRMGIISASTDKHIKRLEDFFLNLQNNNPDSIKILVQTKHLFNSLRSLYCQAQVFY